ncbi:unnamed protein product [Lathyrus sativus]|nr:unnamed protein product [Lathyrus sativus]
MAYAKLSLLPLFLLATSLLMFPMKKVEATRCQEGCSLSKLDCGDGCQCIMDDFVTGICETIEYVTKMVEQHPSLCESHGDCTRKGSGSFCALYPNSDIKYGWCFESNSHAEASFKNALNSEFSNLLKMSLEVST